MAELEDRTGPLHAGTCTFTHQMQRTMVKAACQVQTLQQCISRVLQVDLSDMRLLICLTLLATLDAWAYAATCHLHCTATAALCECMIVTLSTVSRIDVSSIDTRTHTHIQQYVCTW